MRVVDLRAEHHREGHGLVGPRPRLSWRTETGARDWSQASYAIEAVDADTGEELWSSGEIASAESHLLAWGGPDLVSRQRCQWRVRVTGSDGEIAESGWAVLEVGLLDDADWVAGFVVPDSIGAADPEQPVARLRGTFDVPDDTLRVVLRTSSLGVHEVECNGVVVGDLVLSPGWTSYSHRVRYETFDITDLAAAGANVIGVTLADGWYGERYGFFGDRHRFYGDELAALVQVEITDAGGGLHVTGSDESWRSAPAATTSSGLYAGETHDARLEEPGWASPGFADDGWTGVHLLDEPVGRLVTRTGPAVRRIEEVSPAEISRSPTGATIVDFGQNLVGRVRLTVTGPAGTTVTLRHAEILQDGELCTSILRHAAATDRYVLRGDADGETWEPRFTFHGFRYAEVEGWPGELGADDLVAVVVHSDMERTGWFACSDPRIEQLHENVVWGMKGNFLDVPTDCPQRDERMGWTGDIRVFAPTACFLHDVDGFLASWLDDVALEQDDHGGVPFVVPDVLGVRMLTAVWGDAAVVVPWVLHQRYGDRGVLEAQYPSMRACVEGVIRLAGDDRLWNEGFQFGDWVDPAAPPDEPSKARTEPYLVAQASFCEILDVMARTADVVDRVDDARRYRTLREEAVEAFREEFVTPAGRLASDAQTAYALALRDGLIPGGPARDHAADRLVHLVEREGTRIGTGFVGTPILCDALCDTGHEDVAYALLEQTECPSWLYPVLLGATTVWERWDGLRPDGTLNPGEMNSFNHYALGGVADWLHRVVGGLAPADPGYRTIDVRVRPGGSLTAASSRHRTPYGVAETAWRIEGDELVVSVVVPPNTTARVDLPGAELATVGSGEHEWRL